MALKAGPLLHAEWLEKLESIQTGEGREVHLYRLTPDALDHETMSAWAKHFRQHYCLDRELPRRRRGTPAKTNGAYLRDFKFPDEHSGFGPGIRAGDFAEILVSDLLESALNYFVPRTRYADKKVRDESSKGSDVVGLRIHSDDPQVHSPRDELFSVESKARFTKSKLNRLQDAVNDSPKDYFRIAESLNAMKNRLLDVQEEEQADYVERFQDPPARPFVQRYGAAAVLCSTASAYDAATIATTICANHPYESQLDLLCIHGEDLMAFVHALYQRAADES